MHAWTALVFFTFEVQPQVKNFCKIDALSLGYLPSLSLRALLSHTLLQQALTHHIGLNIVIKPAHV